MNKLLYFLLFFASLGAKAQVRPKVNAAGSTTANTVITRGGSRVDSSFNIPNRDTTYVPERSGDMVIRPQDNLMYIYIAGVWYPFQNFVKNIYVTNALTAINDSTIGFGGRQSKSDTVSGRGTFGLLFDSLTTFTIRGPTLTTAPATSALLQTISTTKGVIFSKMTTTQMNAIISPASGTMIYNTDTSAYFQYNGVGWLKMGGQGATTPIVNIYNTDGTLTGARTMNGNGLSLNLDNMDFFLNDINGFAYLFCSPAAQVLVFQVSSAGGAPSSDIQMTDGGLKFDAKNGIVIGQGLDAPEDNPFALKQQSQSSNAANLYWPNFNAGPGTDTLATLRDLRALIPGIDDVLAIGQTLTSDKAIDADTHSLLVESTKPAGSSGYTMAVSNTSVTGTGLLVVAQQLALEVGAGSGGTGILIQSGGNGGAGISVFSSDEGLAAIFQNFSPINKQPSVLSESDEAPTFEGIIRSNLDSTGVISMAQFYRGTNFPIIARDGIGESFDFFIQDNSNQRNFASSIITRLTSATSATRTSQFELDLVNSAVTNAVLKINGNGKINFPLVANFGNFANNAAALSGGLVAGDVYRNGDVLMVVH